MTISDEIKKLRILHIDLELNQNSHIFVLYPEQYFNPDSKTKVEAKLGQTLIIDVEHSVSRKSYFPIYVVIDILYPVIFSLSLVTETY